VWATCVLLFFRYTTALETGWLSLSKTCPERERSLGAFLPRWAAAPAGRKQDTAKIDPAKNTNQAERKLIMNTLQTIWRFSVEASTASNTHAEKTSSYCYTNQPQRCTSFSAGPSSVMFIVSRQII